MVRKRPAQAIGARRRWFIGNLPLCKTLGAESRRDHQIPGTLFYNPHADRQFLTVRALSDRNDADLDLAPGMRRQPAHLDGSGRGQVGTKVGGPHLIELVLFVHVGQKTGRGDQVGKRGAGGFEGLLQVLHAQDRLLVHRAGQVEFFFAVGVAVVDGGGGDARKKNEVTAPDDDRRRVRHDDVAPAVGGMDNRDLLRHWPSRMRSLPSGRESRQSLETRLTCDSSNLNSQILKFSNSQITYAVTRGNGLSVFRTSPFVSPVDEMS